jgi:hypothetical protein
VRTARLTSAAPSLIQRPHSAAGVRGAYSGSRDADQIALLSLKSTQATH